MTTAKPKSNRAAPSHGPHAPTFTKPPLLSDFLDGLAPVDDHRFKRPPAAQRDFDLAAFLANGRRAAAVVAEFAPPHPPGALHSFPLPAPQMSVDELTSALAFLCVLSAVKHGATLTLTGPRSVMDSAPPELRQICATLESLTGARCAYADGEDLTVVLVELAQKYGVA